MALGIFALLFAATLSVYTYVLWQREQRARRIAFVREYKWPPGLLDKLKEKHPYFMRKESALVSQGLRQFFLAFLMSGNKYVAMPSQVVDDLWHEFILYTRAYREFCEQAFGEFLHHTPAVALSPANRSSNEGLRRVWWWTCKEENISPTNPTRLPLLFALDKKLRVPGGYHYTADCEQLRKNGAPGTQCGGDFASTSLDGSTSGMGDSGSGLQDSSSGGTDGGSGDGGGSDSGGGCGGGD